MASFILVDLSNYLHRAISVTNGDAEERASLAIHIILSGLRNVWKRHKFHMVFALDSYSWRNDAYPQYKAHRRVQENDKSLKELKDAAIIKQKFSDFYDYLIKYTNSTVLKANKLEADDLIARWVQIHKHPDNNIIISSDTDFIQLLSTSTSIYDGMQDRYIKIDGIIDSNGNSVEVKKYSIPIDPEWHKFIKCIRGDSSDNIMSAYPRVREKDILLAYQDRCGKGYNWNNFMLHEWVTIDNTKVKVVDRYEFNKSLIDFSCLPISIVELADVTIAESVSTSLLSGEYVGKQFLQYCKTERLDNLLKSSGDIVRMLHMKYNGFLLET